MKLELPPELPISSHASEIGEALSRHQVVVVCGETGSGKTTQLPKICLQPRARAQAGAHRPHPTATHRGARGRGAHRAKSSARPIGR